MLMLYRLTKNIYCFQLQLGLSFNFILERKSLIHLPPFLLHVYKLKLQIHWRLIFGSAIYTLFYTTTLSGLFYLFYICNCFLLMDVSLLMFFSPIKEINRLINKRMSHIYLKVTIERKWHISLNIHIYPIFEV